MCADRATSRRHHCELEAEELAGYGYSPAGEGSGPKRLAGDAAMGYSRDSLRVVATALANMDVLPRRPVPCLSCKSSRPI